MSKGIDWNDELFSEIFNFGEEVKTQAAIDQDWDKHDYVDYWIDSLVKRLHSQGLSGEALSNAGFQYGYDEGLYEGYDEGFSKGEEDSAVELKSSLDELEFDLQQVIYDFKRNL